MPCQLVFLFIPPVPGRPGYLNVTSFINRSIVQTVRVQQEVHDAYRHDAVLIPFGHDVIFDYNDFLERIIDACKRSGLLPYFCFVRHGKCRLNVITPVALVGHKVHFILLAYRLVVPVRGTFLHQAYIHMIPSNTQLIVNDVFHDVAFFLLAKAKQGIADAKVRKIILGQRVDVFLPLDVVTNGFFYQEGVFHIRKVFCDTCR